MSKIHRSIGDVVFRFKQKLSIAANGQKTSKKGFFFVPTNQQFEKIEVLQNF